MDSMQDLETAQKPIFANALLSRLLKTFGIKEVKMVEDAFFM